MTALPTVERRAFQEVRSNGRRLEGYAATFGAEAKLGSFVETIEPGAFRASLAGDILALHDHDPARLLGRTRSRTLRLYEDSKGLGFELALPSTQVGNDVQELAERGDLGGMSFGFTVARGGDHWTGNRRSLRTVGLREVSVVSAWPAYPETELSLRALQHGAEAQRRRRALVLAEAGLWA